MLVVLLALVVFLLVRKPKEPAVTPPQYYPQPQQPTNIWANIGAALGGAINSIDWTKPKKNDNVNNSSSSNPNFVGPPTSRLNFTTA